MSDISEFLDMTVKVQRYVSNKLYYFPGSRGREAADMDRDGTIDSQDVELIKQRILKGE
jgi:hypothetical protein